MDIPSIAVNDRCECTRCRTRLTILERPEPEQHKFQTILASTQDNTIQFLEVESPFFGLYHLPSDTSKNCVDVGVDKFLPLFRHEFGRGKRGVLQLGSSHEKWFAIYDQLPRVCSLSQMRDVDSDHLVLCAWAIRQLSRCFSSELCRGQEKTWTKDTLLRSWAFVDKTPMRPYHDGFSNSLNQQSPSKSQAQG